jgi:DNA-directed RNA polymerase alpha subunit
MTHSEYKVLKEMVTKYEDEMKRYETERPNRRKVRLFELGISTRLNNVLYRSKITTVEELLKCDYNQIMSMRGYGRKLHFELTELFKKHHWEFPKHPWSEY